MLRKGVVRLRHFFNNSFRRNRATCMIHYRHTHVTVITIGLAIFLATSFVIGIYLNAEQPGHRRRRSEISHIARTKANVEQSRVQRGDVQVPLNVLNSEDDINGWNTVRISEGYSLIAACRNGHKTFNAALRSWQNIQKIEEIVVVNWGGSVPDEIRTNSKIRTIHVQGGDEAWSPARALNLAAKLTTRRNVIKADCDATVHWRFMESHRLISRGIFFASSERDGKSSKSQHSTGFLVVRRRSLMEVNGFDERFDAPGWEDSDLYERLVDSGLERRDVEYKYVSHVDHDLVRTGEPELPESQRQRNKVMASLLPRWGSTHRGCSFTFETRDVTIAYLKECPPSLKESITEEDFRNANRRINTELLQTEYGFQSSHLARASYEVLSTLVDIFERKELSLVVRPTGTLPTRMAALGSALELTRLTERYLVIVWIPEEVCPAAWADLFLTHQGRTVGIVESELPPFPETIAATYSTGPGKIPAPLPVRKNETIYVKAEGPIYGDVPWKTLTGSIRSLKPSILVRQFIIDAQVKKPVIGVRVRTRDSPKVESFVQAIRAETEKTSNRPNPPSFVLATDSQTVRRDMLRELGDRIVTVGQACDRPAVECDQTTLAEIWLLMKANRILTGTPEGDYEKLLKASSIPMTIVGVPSVAAGN